MQQPLGPSALDEFRHEMADKSRQLVELELMLADYHAERARLIGNIRRLRARLLNLEEQLQPDQSRHPIP